MGPSSLWICQAARASYLVFQGWRNSTAGCKRTRIREEFPKPGCFALQSGRAFYLALCIASWPSLAGSEDLDCTGALDMAQMKAVKSGPGTQSSRGTRGWFTQLPLCYLCTPPGLSRDLEPGHTYHTKAGCVASQVRLFGTEVPENINYAQKRKNSRGVLGLLNTAELCAGNTERKH